MFLEVFSSYLFMSVAVAIITVFKKPGAVFGALVIFTVLLFFVAWMPNFSFLYTLLTSPFFSPSARIKLIAVGFGSLATNFTPLSRVITITILILASINSVMFVSYFKKRALLYKEAGVGASAFLLGLFGVGCASCGSVIISAIAGAGAAAGFLGVLPLGGQEFGIVSIVLLLVSLAAISRKPNCRLPT